MSNRRHKLMMEIGPQDVTDSFEFFRGQRYGAVGGYCANDTVIPDFSHVRIYPKDTIKAVLVCNMTATITSSLIQYCKEGDIIVARDALNFINGMEGWFAIEFPKDATHAYVSSSNGTMRIMR